MDECNKKRVEIEVVHFRKTRFRTPLTEFARSTLLDTVSFELYLYPFILIVDILSHWINDAHFGVPHAPDTHNETVEEIPNEVLAELNEPQIERLDFRLAGWRAIFHSSFTQSKLALPPTPKYKFVSQSNMNITNQQILETNHIGLIETEILGVDL
ncbi:hypothetical protein GE061_000840 [Apolygus lucorum]|uniref:Uncharacterized protein n=1 Tax=Apolygus lucorum TaxID=248454 RepID=A0A8S9Y7L9_APOLU|nr:hypothetical protein GE061_000840 [Apolygus lucorum]